MNIVALESGLIGCFGIVGGSIAAATGVALALQEGRDEAASVAFFGDGTANQGYFHECLNFAKVFELPVVFVCENNRYGEFTPYEDVTAGEIPTARRRSASRRSRSTATTCGRCARRRPRRSTGRAAARARSSSSR